MMILRTYSKGGRCRCRPLLLFCLGLVACLAAEGRDFTVYRDLVFRKKVHLHFNSQLSFSPRAKTDFSHPDFRQEFFPSQNFRFGMTGMYNFNPSFSLSAGLNLIWFSFYSLKDDYLIPAKYSEIYVTPAPGNYIGDLSNGRGLRFNPYPFFWSVPLNFLHRIPVSNKFDFRYSVGIDLKVYASFTYEAYGSFQDLYNPEPQMAYYMKYEYSPGRKRSLCPDALASFGINRYLKNNKILNVNFFVSVPMYKPVQGEFTFLKDSPYEASGTFTKSDLAFGFELNYIFTFVKREKRLEPVAPEID